MGIPNPWYQAGQLRREIQTEDAESRYEILLGGDQVKEAVGLVLPFHHRNPECQPLNASADFEVTALPGRRW